MSYEGAMIIQRIAVLLVIWLPFVATADPSELQFDGFTINGEGFEQKDVGNIMGQNIKAFLHLAPSEAFAPNVNVIVQDFDGSVADYISLTKKEFDAASLKVLNEHTSGSEWFVEYSGIGPGTGRELHFYARAIQSGAKIYLATATATPNQWKQYSSKLTQCVDSVALTTTQPQQGTAQPQQAVAPPPQAQ